MNKYFALFLSSFMLFSLQAQDENVTKNFYFSLKAGYTIPASKGTIGSPRSEVGNRIVLESTEGDYEFSQKNPFGSRGAGATVAGSFGYMISDHFGVEMEFSFLRSSKILDAKRDETSVVNTNVRNYYAEQYSYTNMFRVAPMLVVTGDRNKKFTPYAKFGVLLPLAGKTIVEVNINDETGELADQLLPILNEELSNDLDGLRDSIPFVVPTESFIKAKTAGAFSVGFTAKMGCTYNISPKWSLIGEMEFNMLSIKAKETTFTDFSSKVSNEGLVFLAEQVLGKEIQSEYGYYDIPEILRVAEYQNEITEDSNASYDINSPNFNKNAAYDQLTFRDNYNSFGFMIGCKYNF